MACIDNNKTRLGMQNNQIKKNPDSELILAVRDNYLKNIIKFTVIFPATRV